MAVNAVEVVGILDCRLIRLFAERYVGVSGDDCVERGTRTHYMYANRFLSYLVASDKGASAYDEQERMSVEPNRQGRTAVMFRDVVSSREHAVHCSHAQSCLVKVSIDQVCLFVYLRFDDVR